MPHSIREPPLDPLDERAECDHCGNVSWLAVKSSGQYCCACLSDEDVKRFSKRLFEGVK